MYVWLPGMAGFQQRALDGGDIDAARGMQRQEGGGLAPLFVTQRSVA
jgi:hypothetical protein